MERHVRGDTSRLRPSSGCGRGDVWIGPQVCGRRAAGQSEGPPERVPCVVDAAVAQSFWAAARRLQGGHRREAERGLRGGHGQGQASRRGGGAD